MIELMKIEGIDSTKSNRSNECLICQYCFFNHEFKTLYAMVRGSWVTVGVYKMYCLNFQSIQGSFFTFLFCYI